MAFLCATPSRLIPADRASAAATPAEFVSFDHRKGLSRRHGDTEMDETEIGIVIVDCAVTLHQGLAHTRRGSARRRSSGG
jgi:hypothetical protein